MYNNESCSRNQPCSKQKTLFKPSFQRKVMETTKWRKSCSKLNQELFFSELCQIFCEFLMQANQCLKRKFQPKLCTLSLYFAWSVLCTLSNYFISFSWILFTITSMQAILVTCWIKIPKLLFELIRWFAYSVQTTTIQALKSVVSVKKICSHLINSLKWKQTQSPSKKDFAYKSSSKKNFAYNSSSKKNWT